MWCLIVSCQLHTMFDDHYKACTIFERMWVCSPPTVAKSSSTNRMRNVWTWHYVKSRLFVNFLGKFPALSYYVPSPYSMHSMVSGTSLNCASVKLRSFIFLYKSLNPFKSPFFYLRDHFLAFYNMNYTSAFLQSINCILGKKLLKKYRHHYVRLSLFLHFIVSSRNATF